MENLSRARSTQFFNTFSAHVHANAILKLLGFLDQGNLVDIATFSARALADVDTTLRTVRYDAAGPAIRGEEDIDMLRSVRSKLLLKLKPIVDLKQDALTQWESFKSESGFVVVARKLLEEAQLSGKGSDYATKKPSSTPKK